MGHYGNIPICEGTLDKTLWYVAAVAIHCIIHWSPLTRHNEIHRILNKQCSGLNNNKNTINTANKIYKKQNVSKKLVSLTMYELYCIYYLELYTVQYIKFNLK